MFVDLADHGGEKRRLRAGEVVGAVGVEDGAVVFNLVEEIFDHAASEVGTMVVDEAEEDEVAVPSVHFIEASAGDHVAVGQIEEALFGDFADFDISHVGDFSRQPAYLEVAEFLRGGDGGWGCESGGKVEHRGRLYFGIDQRFAVGHGAGEAVPTVVNVAEYFGLRS